MFGFYGIILIEVRLSFHGDRGYLVLTFNKHVKIEWIHLTFTRVKSKNIFLVAMLVSMAIWGVSWSSAKVLSSYGSSISIAYIRFVIVLVALYPAMLFLKIPVKIHRRGIMLVIGAGLCLAVYSTLFFRGLQEGLSGAGGVLVTTLNPIMAYALGLVIEKRAPTKFELSGLALGLCAGAVLIQIWLHVDQLWASGNLYFLCAAFLWSVMSKLTSQSAKYGHVIAFTWWMHVITIVVTSCIVDFSDVAHIITTGDSRFWWNIAYFGIINSSMATTIYMFATIKIGAEKASSFIFLVPVGAVLSSWLFLDELITWNVIVGGSLGIIAVLAINRSSRLKKV